MSRLPRVPAPPMPAPFPNLTYLCFGASYLLAWAVEVVRLNWPRPGLRTAGLALGGAGLAAHSAFLAFRHPNPAAGDGALLAVAWLLAVFYMYAAVHHPKQAWAVFVLPVVAGLVGLSVVAGPAAGGGGHLWGAVHGLLLLAAAAGLGVGFLASAMYLVQADRLRAKRPPSKRFKLLSLERLEAINRQAVNAAFPLLTLGLLLGGVLLRQYHGLADNVWSVKVLGTLTMWAVFLMLLYLRYAAHVSGRRMATLTAAAFALMLVVLAAAHPFAGADPIGGRP